MLKNYFKVAFRNLIKHKTYSFIHITGLTIGIACLVLILKFVHYELSFDQFNINANRIYRIAGHDWAQTPVPLSTDLRQFYPEIINTVRIHKINKVLLGCEHKKFYEEGVIFSDPSIFNVFSFPLIDGNPNTIFEDPYSVVISQNMAKKYFGTENPVGRTFTYDEKYNFTVTGIFNNIPVNSHIKFDFVFSLKSADKVFYKDFFENMMNTVVYNYFLLNKSNNISGLQSRLMDFTKYRLGEGFFNDTREGKWRIEYQIQPLTSIHLHSNLGGEFEPNGDITSVYIFSAIAALILLIACINFINLSTARYMNRLKEVGIRKVIGANRLHITYQFIGESVLFSFLAILIVVSLIEILTPWLGSEFGVKEIFSKGSFEYVFFLIGIALFTGLVSGLYPALFISRFNPINILSKTILRTNKRFSFGNVLISFQFVVSTILIIATIIVSSQLSHIQNKRLGFNKEQIIVIPLYDNSVRSQYKIFKDELLQQQGIVGISASSIIPGGVKYVRSFGWDGMNTSEDNSMCYISADQDFLKTYEIKILEGRDFSQLLSTDTSQGFLVNQAALAKLRWSNPIGKRIDTFGKQGSVIGLVKDFHFKSLHEKIEPLIIYCDPGTFEFLSIRIKTSNIPEVLNSIEKKWKSFYKEKPYEYFFFDEYWGKLYQKEYSMKNLFSVFAGFAIFIACLGLFGLAAFSSQNRTKEIGIRKVLGASVYSVLIMLTKDFTKWILVANIIAWPIAYYAMNKWLEDFAYRIEIGWWVFVLSGGIALLIALATVSFQAIKAATANPVESLKYE